MASALPDARRRAQSDWVGGIALSAGVSGAAAALFFSLWPGIDIAAARLFATHDGGFAGSTALVQFIRYVLQGIFIAACLLAVAGLSATWSRPATWLGQGVTGWLFLAMCLGVGPGIVANLALKDQWGRARPAQLAEFGGTRAFTPALQPSDQCRRNCSFVSGEASSMFMVFFAAAFMRRRRARQFVLAGIGLGALAGLVRMSQGAHFLSDVVFAGVLMALTAAAISSVFRLVAAAGKDGLPDGLVQPTA